jgi:hypothetical protein
VIDWKDAGIAVAVLLTLVLLLTLLVWWVDRRDERYLDRREAERPWRRP